jgi:hypothetical protein
MFSAIPFNRLIIYLCIAALLPAALVFFLFQKPMEERSRLIWQLQSATMRAKNFEMRQATNLALRSQFLEANHYYIDKQLESLSFLKPEAEVLQNLSRSNHLAENDGINKRVEFLTGKGNKLSFSEGVVQTYPYFKETVETLVHPVEINVSDMQQILSSIEGVKIGSFEPEPDRPQLIILDFKIEKKRIYPNNQVFLLNLKLLKREYT